MSLDRAWSLLGSDALMRSNLNLRACSAAGCTPEKYSFAMHGPCIRPLSPAYCLPYRSFLNACFLISGDFNETQIILPGSRRGRRAAAIRSFRLESPRSAEHLALPDGGLDRLLSLQQLPGRSRRVRH